ncbi:MAG: hypothetical protein AB9866_04605 [Syntrophobacteraceae bacterium]
MDGHLASAIAFFAVSALVLILFYIFKITSANREYRALYKSSAEVCLRKFPYPYKAALAICSDIDRTRTAEQFIKIQRFLNTSFPTEMGKGVGLEIGNSFFMWPRNKNVFSYFSNRPLDKIIIKRFIEAGYLDVLHSWGEGCDDRRYAINAVSELDSNNLKIKVWVNHAMVKNNLGFSFPNYHLDKGDNKNTEHYHADVTIPYGIKFVWTGASTWVIGQNTTTSIETFTGSFDSHYPFKSTINILKAFSKHILSLLGILHSRYDKHSYNDLVRPYILDDGQKVYEFMRYDNHFDGIGKGAFAKTMHYNLSTRVINQLKKVNGYAILYTHFGINDGCKEVICEDTQAALRLLEQEFRTGEVYVSTTSKLLSYHINHKFLRWSFKQDEAETHITINCIDDPIFGKFIPCEDDLQGITFYVPKEKKARVFIGTREILGIVRNSEDEANRQSVTIPHKNLIYPELDDLDLELENHKCAVESS